MENFELNRRELDRYLGAYPYEEYKRWVSLTNNINETFLEKLIPESKIISSGQKLIGQEFKSEKSDHNKLQFEKRFQPPESLAEAEKRLPDILIEKGSNIRFSNIPLKYIPRDATPLEVSYLFHYSIVFFILFTIFVSKIYFIFSSLVYLLAKI